MAARNDERGMLGHVMMKIGNGVKNVIRDQVRNVFVVHHKGMLRFQNLGQTLLY